MAANAPNNNLPGQGGQPGGGAGGAGGMAPHVTYNCQSTVIVLGEQHTHNHNYYGNGVQQHGQAQGGRGRGAGHGGDGANGANDGQGVGRGRGPTTQNREVLGKDANSNSDADETEEELEFDGGTHYLPVIPCDPDFYRMHYKQAYPMNSAIRGKVLIINVKKVWGQVTRHGTDIDRDNLKHLWKQLGFDVTVHNDSDGLSAKQIQDKMDSFISTFTPDDQACVMFLLSHGVLGYILGTDGNKVSIDDRDLHRLFASNPVLTGKPKLIFIQACRGHSHEEEEEKVYTDRTYTGFDLLIGYPTVKGDPAYRTARGSWYIEALTKVFAKYAHKMDVQHLLNEVNAQISKKTGKYGEEETSECLTRLRKPLYFFPGITM